jgi:hypothetical protein
MKPSSTRAGFFAVLTGVASALGATACGNTESNPAPQSKADSNHGGGGAAGNAGQPQASGTGGPASGTGGRPSAGTGQTASAGSESPAGDGGGVPALNPPLIVGDDACPAEAPMRLDGCPEPGVSCVYRGLIARVNTSNEPFRCTCDGDTWACAQSGENGEEICPLVTELPGPNVACPTSGEPCSYWLPGYLGLALCYCTEDDSAGGAAGAGGAGPSSIWGCSL